MLNHVPGTFVNYRADFVLYSDFVDKELILAAIARTKRTIPSVVDGLSLVQRKVVCTMLKRKHNTEIGVGILAGDVSEQMVYNHKMIFLEQAIVKLAQIYVGRNNVPLLESMGQFGTRHHAGLDAANPAYLYTRLEPVAQMIFHPKDDGILNFLIQEGREIEPCWYIPILPLILINGTLGIGSSVPMYSYVDIIVNLKLLIDGERMNEILPFYRGFIGEVEKIKDGPHKGNFITRGVWEELDDDTIRITELPIGMNTEDYKIVLVNLVKKGIVKGENSTHLVVFRSFLW
jgi:DNA topoisomerase-2